MKLAARHIFLLTGIFSVTISFLFFASAHTVYGLLLTIGLVMAIVSYCFIFSRDKWQGIIIWSVVIISSRFIEQSLERHLVRQSFKNLISNNSEALDKVNSIFISKPGDIIYIKIGPDSSKKIFSQGEIDKIDRFLKQTEIRLIIKDSAKVYYEIYGMLDVRVGFSFLYSKAPTDYGTGLKTYFGKWEY